MRQRESIPTHMLARLAGVLYLVIILCGVGGDGLVRSPITAKGGIETVTQLLAAESAFRASILADVLMVLADIGLGGLLYILLAPVNKTLALLAMVFRLAQASILGLNLVHLTQAVSLAHTSVFSEAQRSALVNTALQSHAIGYDLGLFCFAFNCIAVGLLLLRMKPVLRWIGGGIILAGLVYLIGSTLRIVAPTLASSFAAAYLIPLITEVAFCGWLLVSGRLAQDGPERSLAA